MHAAIFHEFRAEKGETSLNKTITTHDTCQEIRTLLIMMIAFIITLGEIM